MKGPKCSVSLIPKGTWKNISRLVLTLNWLAPFSFLSNIAEDFVSVLLRQLPAHWNSFPILWFINGMAGDSQSHSSPFIQWGTVVLHLSAQKFELWTRIYERTQTSTLLVHFWQQLLYYRNHLVPGSRCFLVFTVLVRSLGIASLATDLHLPVSLWRLPWIHPQCSWCSSHHARILEKHPKATLSGWNFIYVPIYIYFFLSKRHIFPLT